MKTTKRFYPIEVIALLYMALTAVYIIVFWSSIKDGAAGELLWARGIFTAVMVGLYVANRYSNAAFLPTLRQVAPLAFVVHFYPETYYLNHCIFTDYLDDVFIRIDQLLFGCQPSIRFSELLPSAWFNELMNFAYFSYFFAILGIILYLLFYDKAGAYRSAFILLCSFFIYYTIFIVLPTEGPQFYEFDHDTALPVLGPMRKLLLFFHSVGERPTGAVPSSHVGIMVIYMWLLWQHGRRLFWWMLPLSVLLVLATVYIRAHYAIDVLLGFASAPVIYRLSNECWKKMERCRPQIFTD
jgi:membrane-associated phospholipid phosphatase